MQDTPILGVDILRKGVSGEHSLLAQSHHFFAGNKFGYVQQDVSPVLALLTSDPTLSLHNAQHYILRLFLAALSGMERQSFFC